LPLAKPHLLKAGCGRLFSFPLRLKGPHSTLNKSLLQLLEPRMAVNNGASNAIIKLGETRKAGDGTEQAPVLPTCSSKCGETLLIFRQFLPRRT
jgi:hypothetical protein